MRVDSVSKMLSFNQWKNLENNQYLFCDLIMQKNKNLNNVRNLDKNYANYESDECSVLLGEMNRILRESDNVYDYDCKNNIILKEGKGKNIPLNTTKQNLIKNLYKEVKKLKKLNTHK